MGQSYSDITGAQRFSSSRALDDFSNLKSEVSENEKIDDIKGSMYFNNNFEESTVFFNGVPVDERVAHHFFAIIPLFPTPEMIILPFLEFNIVFTNILKDVPILE